MKRTRHYSHDPEEPVFFYGGVFSSFVGGPIEVSVRVQWPEADVLGPLVEAERAEHYFQAAKSMSRKDADWVLAAGTPSSAKRRGGSRGERRPDGTVRKTQLRPDWEEIKFEVMLHVVRAKFSQPGFREQLLATGNRLIAEDSPVDFEWGIRDATGGFGGKNLLGKALMQAREELAA